MFDHDTPIELLAGELGEDETLDRLTQADLRRDWVEPDRHVLPAGLEDLPPGPYLSAIAASVDRTKLNGHDAVRLMKVEARLSSHYEAEKLATMVEVAHSPGGDSDAPVERNVEELEYAAFEIGSALRLTRRAAESELDLALSLAGKLNQVWEKFHRGLIDLRRVKVFENQLGHLIRASVPIAVLSISMLMLPRSPNCRMPPANWLAMARSLPIWLARSL